MRSLEIALVALLVLLLGGAIFLWTHKGFELPAPAGKYRIGTTTLHLENGSQKTPRKLILRMWYPAAKGSGKGNASYVPEGQTSRFGRFSDIGMARTHAFEDADVEGTTLPLILYSPLWEGGSFQNTTLFEALASEGFVVAAIELPKELGSPAPPDFSTEEAYQKFQDTAGRELELRTSDILWVFGLLSELNSGERGEGKFKNRLDLAAVGVMGYSFGGAVAAEALSRESGLRSGVNLDGALFGNSAKQGAKQPFLFITDSQPLPPDSQLHSADPPTRRNAEFTTRAIEQMDQWLARHGGALVQLDDVQHSSFSDIPLYAFQGKFDKERQNKAVDTLQKINLCAVVFFDETLRGNPSALLSKDSTPWPGVKIRRFNSP